MIDFLKLIGLHNQKEKCLVCEKPAGKDAAIMRYKFEGGEGEAFVCKKCADALEKPKLGDLDETI